jgi:hypothetical protein
MEAVTISLELDRIRRQAQSMDHEQVERLGKICGTLMEKLDTLSRIFMDLLAVSTQSE